MIRKRNFTGEANPFGRNIPATPRTMVKERLRDMEERRPHLSMPMTQLVKHDNDDDVGFSILHKLKPSLHLKTQGFPIVLFPFTKGESFDKTT